MISKYINALLTHADWIGLALVFFILILFNKRIKLEGKKWIFIFYSIFLILTLLITWWSNGPIHNVFIYDALPLLQIAILYFFFIKLARTSWLRTANKLLIIITLLYYFISWDEIYDDFINSEFNFFLLFFVLINATGYLLDVTSEFSTGNIFLKLEFWFILSFLFYLIISGIIWSLFQYLNTKYGSFSGVDLWKYCHNLPLLLHCIIFSSAIIWMSKKK